MSLEEAAKCKKGGVKRMASADDIMSTLNDTLDKRPSNFCLVYLNDRLQLNRKHKFFYQIQGQLNIAQKKYCYFVVQSSNSQPQHIEKIEVDKSFWESKMLPKLKEFYI